MLNTKTGKIPLSVVVITKNEEANIEKCLGSALGWADELLVVDDESTDKTVELSKKLSARVLHRKMDNEGIHRNWSYSQAKNEWVLSLDADEYVTEELKRAITEAIKKDDFQAYTIPLKNYIGSYFVRYSGWYPAGKTRLFMKSKFRYEEVEVHPKVFLDGKTGFLEGDIVHKGYPDFEHFLGSLNRQTTLEARKWINTGRQMSLGRAVWRTLDRFPRSFFGKRGFKDGFIGFMIAFFASLYQIMSYAKYWQMKRENNQTK
ncbi:MAG: glycosyltransferase family 2 protein [Candidatus Omnitrophica bacterium]|nr:glycosyltransferase family 2 protein [Candidatus Omnitrophota bacterium]